MFGKQKFFWRLRIKFEEWESRSLRSGWVKVDKDNLGLGKTIIPIPPTDQ